MKTIKYIFVIIAIVMFSMQVSAADKKRDKIKAVFLYKFFDYVTWQDGHDPKKEPPATICTIGTVSFAETLYYLSEKYQNSFSNKVTPLSKGRNGDNCNILYIAPGKLKNINLSEIGNVLTVSDSRGFAKSGGMVELRDSKDKVGIVVNLPVAQKHGLRISSKLLSISNVIR